MKKSIFMIVAAVIAFALVACNNGAIRTKENIADFEIKVSDDLFDIADLYIDYTKGQSATKVAEVTTTTSQFGQRISGTDYTFRYVGDDDEIGLKIVAKLKNEYTEKTSYNLNITLKSVLVTKTSSGSVTDSKVKTISIDEMKDGGTVAAYYYYKIKGDGRPVLSEEQPVDWVLAPAAATPAAVSKYNGMVWFLDFDSSASNGTTYTNFRNRIPQYSTTYSDAALVVVIAGDSVSKLSETTYSDIVKVGAKDGKIVLIDVKKAQFTEFVDNFIKYVEKADKTTFSEAFRTFTERLKHVGDKYVNFKTSDEVINIIGICNSNLYIHSNATSSNSSGTLYYNAAYSMNSLVEWLNSDYKDGVKEAYAMAVTDSEGMQLDISDKVQVINTCFYAAGYKGWDNKSVPVDVTYYVFPAHNLDNGDECYIVEELVNADNSKWNCTITDEDIWVKASTTPSGVKADNIGTYGSYMTSLVLNNEINTSGDAFEIKNCTPDANGTSTNVVTDIDFNMEGNIGFAGSGVKAGLDGAVNVKYSKAGDITDLNYSFESDGTSAKYTYAADEITTTSNNVHWNKHGIAKGSSVSDMTSVNGWVWNIKNKNTDKIYTFFGSTGLTSESLEYCDNGTTSTTTTYKNNSGEIREFTLLPPARFSERYTIVAETPAAWDKTKAEEFQNFIANMYPDYYGVKNVYSTTGTYLDELAKDYFNEALAVFTRSNELFAKKGYNGTVKFYIKNSDNGSALKYSDITIGDVK